MEDRPQTTCRECGAPTILRRRFCELHERKCESDGCNERHFSGGLCSAHHLRKVRGRDDGSPIGKMERESTPPSKCLFDGCGDDTYGRFEYCRGHYQQQKRGESLRPKRFVKRNINWICTISGCPSPGRSKGMCKFHAGKARKYSLTADRLNLLLATESCQICGICLRVESDKYVDHDHSCCSGGGSCGDCVRGILCRACNTGIGMFRDDVSNLASAINYLVGIK